MSTRPRRLEHFPKMKVRGFNGYGRELCWGITGLAAACQKFLDSTAAAHSRPPFTEPPR